MSRSLLYSIQLTILLVGVSIVLRQRAELRSLRAIVDEPRAQTTVGNATTVAPEPVSLSQNPRPSLEQLRLRAEVTQLRQELDAMSAQARAASQRADEWAQVWDGVRPSEVPGFQTFAQLSPAGFATPQSAYASFQHAMRHQPAEPMSATRMKEFWHLPDDFDDPKVRYSIHIGQGLGGDVGYRVVKQEAIGPGRVRLTVDLENTDGSSYQEERILVEQDGRWRLEPQGLERVADSPEEASGPDPGPAQTSSSPVFLPRSD